MRKSKVLSLLMIGVLALGVLSGCSKEAPEKEEVESDNKVEDVAGNPVKIEHKLGETVLEDRPRKVIVFDYGILDAMEEMGLGDRVVGLPKKSVPEYLDKFKGEEYEDIGTLQEPNFELMYEMKPDLIIIGDRQADAYNEFEEIAPTLYVSIMDGEYMELFEKNMINLGKIFDIEDEAAEKIEEVKAEVGELHNLARERGGKSLFLMANDGELNVYGKGSRFGVLFNEFGVSPVDEEIDVSTHGQKITYEYIVENDPDFIFVMDRGQITGADTSAKDVMENELIETTKAYKNDKIVYLNSPIWYVASGGINSTKIMVEDIMNGLK